MSILQNIGTRHHGTLKFSLQKFNTKCGKRGGPPDGKCDPGFGPDDSAPNRRTYRASNNRNLSNSNNNNNNGSNVLNDATGVTHQSHASLIKNLKENHNSTTDSSSLVNQNLGDAIIGIANLGEKTHQLKIVVTCKNLKPYCYFILDSDSSVNLIKVKMLKNTPIDVKDFLNLKGITINHVKALGSVIFKEMNSYKILCHK